jgi:sulfur relay (sulfurtransferase) DsrF/TusC family protein
MTSHVFIASRGPWDCDEQRTIFEVSISLANAGAVVTIYLTDNAVLAAQAQTAKRWLKPLTDARIELLVDPTSMSQRGLRVEDLAPRVDMLPLNELVELMAA